MITKKEQVKQLVKLYKDNNDYKSLKKALSIVSKWKDFKGSSDELSAVKLYNDVIGKESFYSQLKMDIKGIEIQGIKVMLKYF